MQKGDNIIYVEQLNDETLICNPKLQFSSPSS